MLQMGSGFSKPWSPGSRNVCSASVPASKSACESTRIQAHIQWLFVNARFSQMQMVQP